MVLLAAHRAGCGWLDLLGGAMQVRCRGSDRRVIGERYGATVLAWKTGG